VSHAVSNHHVKLLLIILDSEHHGHGLSNLDEATHFGGPWSLSDLDLHPASHIVSGKVSSHHVQHVNREWPERDRFLVLIMPSAAKLPGLVPDLLYLRVVLHHDRVFEESAGPGVCAVPVEAVFCIAGGAAGVDCNIKLGAGPTYSGWKMNTVHVAVESLAENDSVERFVELN